MDVDRINAVYHYYMCVFSILLIVVCVPLKAPSLTNLISGVLPLGVANVQLSEEKKEKDHLFDNSSTDLLLSGKRAFPLFLLDMCGRGLDIHGSSRHGSVAGFCYIAFLLPWRQNISSLCDILACG